MTHEALIGRGATWLQRTLRCEPVFHGLSTGPEIPDVIGWTSMWKWRGSVVLECKVSRSDFLRDRKKKHGRRMGDYRLIVTPPGLISSADIAAHCPDHGLIWIDDRLRVEMIVHPPRREKVNHAAEVRHLRMALIHAGYNIAAHGYTVHWPTLSMFNRPHGMRQGKQ